MISIELFQLNRNKEVDKKMWIGISKVLARIYVSIPIKSGDLICKNILKYWN